MRAFRNLGLLVLGALLVASAGHLSQARRAGRTSSPWPACQVGQLWSPSGAASKLMFLVSICPWCGQPGGLAGAWGGEQGMPACARTCMAQLTCYRREEGLCADPSCSRAARADFSGQGLPLVCHSPLFARSGTNSRLNCEEPILNFCFSQLYVCL